MQARPFAYLVTDWDGDYLGTYQTLRDVVNGSRGSAFPGMQRVTAVFPGPIGRPVPREAYQRPDPPAVAEALVFIRERAAKIARARAAGVGVTVAELRGIARCNPDDPEDKQVADYIASAPWAWREDPDETWWQAGRAET